MISALQGTVASITDQTVIIMVQGVGYAVSVPRPSSYTPATDVSMHTYLAVRETALDLYGFSSPEEKQVFELLLKVPKIGPKSALQVLTSADPSLLLECIATTDPSRLHKLSGVGKKTCENIVTALQDKIPDILTPQSATTTQEKLSTTQQDAIDALISLGFEHKQARDAVAKHTDDTLSVSDLVSRSLK